MQSPEYEHWPELEPKRLLSFTDQELCTMIQTATGLTAAALREVLYLRQTIHNMVSCQRNPYKLP